MTILKAGLVQMGLKAPITDSAERIREVMLDAHAAIIDRAGAQGVQVLCLQELFALPYFPFSRDRKWYAGAERVPDGPTTALMQELARRHAMVIVAPVFEEHIPGVYYNTAAVIDADGTYLGKYRKNHFGHVEWPWFKRGNLGYPVFRTAYAPLGVYICYDRHFPEGWRLLAMSGAELIVNHSATIESMSRHMWELEQPAAALANGCFVGTVNRVGSEGPWDADGKAEKGRFYGSSYFADPRGEIIAKAGEDDDELLVCEMDLDTIREVRHAWQFFKNRRFETYGPLSDIRSV